MKEFIEKLIGRLEELPTKRDMTDYVKTGQVHIYVDKKDVKDAVNQLAWEYNNGWIPCSERSPEEFEDIYIDGKLMDSDDGQSYKSVFGETEQKDCFYGYYHNGKFFGYTEEGVFWRIDAIAWQPLPAPYKKGE